MFKHILVPTDGSELSQQTARHAIAFAKSIGADAIHPLAMFVDDEYIENCHNAGLMVNPWTVDKDYAIARLNERSADGVITNYPDLARGIIG